MPSFHIAFPSKYLKAEDLGTTRPVVTIATVGFETVGVGTKQERKLVLHFEKEVLKPLVLNRINCETLAEVCGTEDYDQWPGHRVELFASKTEFQGKRVACVRLCAPQTPKATMHKGAQKAVGPTDEVGF